MTTRTSIAAALAASMAVTVTLAGAQRAAAEDIDWAAYMQSSSVAAAIAAAIAQVDQCSKKPLVMEEIRDGDNRRTLVFTCAGTEEDEGSAILHLERFEGGPWRPKAFDLAG